MSDINFIKSSFWSLLSSKEIETITIPIIQRAYSQGGRKGNKKTEKKGQRFLDRLIRALKGEPIVLDFIYGSKDINHKLYPLDGQQRLTTLFLLHWYIAQKENKLSEEVIKTLKKFSYETRQSSRYFCEHLSEWKIENWKNSLSDTIKNQRWFMLSWEADPSIYSMLQMLNKIEHALQEENTNFWELLTENANNSPITFFYTSLEELNQTDDLYIKMNARGLELTDFEKLKASFSQKIDEKEWDKENIIEETFAHKIDTVWTDLFWKFQKSIEHKDNTGNTITDFYIDEELCNFISGTAINYYAQNLEIEEDPKEEEVIKKELSESHNKTVTYEAIKRERIEKRIAYLANNPNEVTPNDFSTKDAFNYLKKCLNKYSEKAELGFTNSELKAEVPLWDYSNSALFKEFIHYQGPQYKPRILFYAQTAYLLNNETLNNNLFSEWMRVIRNIVENSTIDSSATFTSAVSLIKELANGAADIYSYLATNNIQSRFAHEQINEEIRKAKIITANDAIKRILFELEDTEFCKGCINWCLECVNAIDGDIVSNLGSIKNIITEHFANYDISNTFRRALLTIGNNKFYNYWGSWSYNTETFKRCLIEDRNELKRKFTKDGLFDDYFKPLITQLINKNIEDIIAGYICPDNMPNWQKRLIQEPALLDKYCQRHYFGITRDGQKCYLYGNKKRPSGKNDCKLIK